MIALAMTYNGRRDALEETILSLAVNLSGPITRRVVVDDSGTGELSGPPADIVVSHAENLGMAISVQNAWRVALEDPKIRFVCHWEDDMRLDRPVELAALAGVLDRHPELAQITLQRHPVNHVEADGQLTAIVRQSKYPGVMDTLYGPVTYHDDLFSLNPCLIPRAVCEMGWPSGPLGVGNESGMTKKCHDAGLKFATWGTVSDEPYVTHIGADRSPAWQL